MHVGPDFLRTLAAVLGVAAVTTVVFQRLRQPVVFGYMLAGLIIGPHVPIPLVADQGTVRTLSELGVILLMFSLGLEFNLRRLFGAGWGIVVIAVLETSAMIWLGHEAARLLGWPLLASLYAGAALAISSTTIIVKAVGEPGMRSRATETVFGILIVEDLIAILLLALLTPAGTPAGPGAGALGLTFLRLIAFLAAFLAAGLVTVPGFMRMVVRLKRSEITLVVSIGICFCAAVLVQSIGYSVALGAFLAGALVAESGEARIVERLVAPVRDMFLAVFFVSVGMMIVPATVIEHWRSVALFTGIVVAGKIGAVSFASFLTGAGIRGSVQTGMSMAQIGEFSFIIVTAGIATGSVPAPLYPIVIAVSALTTLGTPWLIRFAGPAAAWIDGNLPRRLQTFAVFYGTWIENARRHPETSADRLRLRRTLRAIALDAAVVAALCVGAVLGVAPLGERIAGRTGFAPGLARVLLTAAALAASVPFLVGIVRTGRALGDLLSRRAFAEPVPGRLDPAAAPRRALVVAVQLATVLGVVTPLVAITQPLLPPFVGAAVLLGLALVLGAIFWRSAADLQGHVRAAAEAIVRAVGEAQRRGAGAPEAERALERAYALVPGLGEPVPMRIAEGSPFAGRLLSEAALRGRTGATVVAISRGDDVVLVPDGHEVLRPGDVLALAGTREAVDAARRLLAQG